MTTQIQNIKIHFITQKPPPTPMNPPRVNACASLIWECPLSDWCGGSSNFHQHGKAPRISTSVKLKKGEGLMHIKWWWCWWGYVHSRSLSRKPWNENAAADRGNRRRLNGKPGRKMWKEPTGVACGRFRIGSFTFTRYRWITDDAGGDERDTWHFQPGGGWEVFVNELADVR